MTYRPNRPRRPASPKKIQALRLAGWRYSSKRSAWVHRAFNGRVGPVFVDPSDVHPRINEAIVIDHRSPRRGSGQPMPDDVIALEPDAVAAVHAPLDDKLVIEVGRTPVPVEIVRTPVPIEVETRVKAPAEVEIEAVTWFVAEVEAQAEVEIEAVTGVEAEVEAEDVTEIEAEIGAGAQVGRTSEPAEHTEPGSVDEPPRRPLDQHQPEVARLPLPPHPLDHDTSDAEVIRVNIQLTEFDEPRVVRVDGRPPRRVATEGRSPHDVVVPIDSTRAYG